MSKINFNENISNTEILLDIRGLLQSQSKVLSAKYLCIRLDISYSKLTKLTSLGLIPTRGNEYIDKLFFDRDEIDEWILGKPNLSDEFLEQKMNEQLQKKR